MKLDPARLAEYDSIRHPAITDRLCHAPFVGMNFDQFGRASACCLNRVETLGRYPEHTIDQMWFGEAVQRLRQVFEQRRLGQLGDGCEACRMEIATGNAAGTHALLFDELELRARNQSDRRSVSTPLLPTSFEFELSNVCNLECVMCHGEFSHLIRKNREQRPPLEMPYDDAFVDQLDPYLPHLLSLKFLGGEPFLVRLYHKIWDRAIAINPAIEVHITTNGTIFDRRVERLLDMLRCHLTISLDSLEPKKFSEIRVNAELDRVLDNFFRFHETSRRRGTSLTISVCPMVSNWQEMPTFLDFGSRHGIGVYFNTVLRPRQLSLAYLEPATLERILQQFESVELDPTTAVERTNAKRFDGLIRQLRGWQQMALERRSGPKEHHRTVRQSGAAAPSRECLEAIESVALRHSDGDVIDPGANGKAIFSSPREHFLNHLINQILAIADAAEEEADHPHLSSNLEAFEGACRRIPASQRERFRREVIDTDPLQVFRMINNATPDWLIEQVESRYGRED